MYLDETEIIQILERGRQILADDPELERLSVDQLLDRLDDGSREMLRNRWGAAACLCAGRIRDHSYEGLIRELSGYENTGFLCSFTAYILQKERGIRVVRLLMEADRQGMVPQILPFVIDNLFFDAAVELTEMRDFLRICGMLPADRKCGLLGNYAELIAGRSLTDAAAQALISGGQQDAAEFMPYLCRAAYGRDYDSGECLLERLITGLKGSGAFLDGVWEGLRLSTSRGTRLFERYFPMIKELRQDSETWQGLIPAFMNVIEQENANPEIREQALDALRGIAGGTVGEKRSFLQAVVYRREPGEELVRIQDAILECSFEKDPAILNALQSYFYGQRDKMTVEEVLDRLHRIFLANEYGLKDYEDFFGVFAQVLCREPKDQKEIWRAFLRSMFAEEIQKVAFARGLYEEVLDVDSMAETAKETELSLPELKLLLQMAAYYDIDGKRGCRFAFELTGAVRETDSAAYIQTYMDHLYRNYRHSSRVIAEACSADPRDPVQAGLAAEILDRYQADRALQDKAWAVPDLRPSEERGRIYQKVQCEQNAKINKMANETSLATRLFPRMIIKYGKRSAHVQAGRKDRQFYSVQPYSVIEQEYELPALYLENPLAWRENRLRFWEERGKYLASDHQGLSSAVKGEGGTGSAAL